MQSVMHVKLDHVPGSLVVASTYLPALQVYDYSLACAMLCGNCLYYQNSYIVDRYIFLLHILMISLEIPIQGLLISERF